VAEIVLNPGMASDCHGGPVWVAGRTTQYHLCGICRKACDAVPEAPVPAAAPPGAGTGLTASSHGSGEGDGDDG
jgi:hypothetical protein